MNDDEIMAEWERLVSVFGTRSDLYDVTTARHKRERDLVWEDLANAGSAMDRFKNQHADLISARSGAGRGRRDEQ